MDNFFGDFDDLFTNLFNRFNRPVLDQRPISVFKEPGKGYIIVANTLGLNKDNVTVKLEQQKGRPFPILRIKGEAQIPNIDFHNSIDLGVSLNFENKIDGVSYTVKDGLTTVFLKVSVPEETNKIEAKYVDDGNSSLDW